MALPELSPKTTFTLHGGSEIGPLFNLFINRLNTEERLTRSNTAMLPGANHSTEKHPLIKAYKNDQLEKTLSSKFRQAFGASLAVNRRGGQDTSLHVGDFPNREAYPLSKEEDYYTVVASRPRLDEQGDGMRGFASILLDTLTSDYSISLFDEPDAFLHPPQARLLGRMLASLHDGNQQLFISTHSEDFLQGLLEANSEDVSIIRIDRQDITNEINVLDNAGIRDLWINPLLRYSKILSGLFYKKVIVCESDYDCLFYQAIMDALFENKEEQIPDILFVHCGGKSRMKVIIKALSALRIPVVAIPDFDIIDNRAEFKSLFEAFNANWEEEVCAHMTEVYNWLNANKEAKNHLKRTGKSILDGAASGKYSLVENACRAAGLFIVPVGELECFDKSINKDKKDWIYSVLERNDLAADSSLQDARDFVQSIIDF